MKHVAPSVLIAALVLTSLSGIQAQNTGGLKAEREKLQKLDSAYRSAKNAWKKSPSSVPAKKKYIDATVKYGTAVMNSPALTPKDKYPRALNLYREALKIDPKNKEALENKKLIEDIYRQMGRPIPK